MACRFFLVYTALWATVSSLSRATALALSNETLSFVPQCAQACLGSYVATSFSSSICGYKPAHKCLCVHTGSLGSAIGEGAAECIGAEASRGTCVGDDATQQALEKAYAMCSGVAGAAAETHAILVATMVIPSGTGLITFLSGTATATPTTTSASFTSSAGTAASETASAQPTATGRISRSAGLTHGEVVGILVGAVTLVALLGMTIVCLARCVRRRRFGDAESSFCHDERWFKGEKLGSPPQISGPKIKTPVEMDFKRPGDAPFNVPPKAIGLDVTDEQPAAGPLVTGAEIAIPTPRPQTKPDLPPPVPAKPALTLSIPGWLIRPPPRNDGVRDSVVTEFAEDGENEADVQVWRPPVPDPQSTAKFYVADKWGNWMLGKMRTSETPPAATLEAPGPLSATRADVDTRCGMAFSGTSLTERTRQPLACPVRMRDSATNRKLPARPRLFRRKSSRRASADSATSIESFDVFADLSPVAESPGNVPISYPKDRSPPSQSSQSPVDPSLLPPPLRTGRALQQQVALGLVHPPGKSRPTLPTPESARPFGFEATRTIGGGQRARLHQAQAQQPQPIYVPYHPYTTPPQQQQPQKQKKQQQQQQKQQ